ncbi:UNVERIFIED_CONTAM: hypothetical protein HDU68_007788 [Siphonaria sp. JEL0065]|nr:hypothetical protein HDU68_007788 [Siphonaria sp. JEL0065]
MHSCGVWYIKGDLWSSAATTTHPMKRKQQTQAVPPTQPKQLPNEILILIIEKWFLGLQCYSRIIESQVRIGSRVPIKKTLRTLFGLLSASHVTRAATLYAINKIVSRTNWYKYHIVPGRIAEGFTQPIETHQLPGWIISYMFLLCNYCRRSRTVEGMYCFKGFRVCSQCVWKRSISRTKVFREYPLFKTVCLKDSLDTLYTVSMFSRQCGNFEMYCTADVETLYNSLFDQQTQSAAKEAQYWRSREGRQEKRRMQVDQRTQWITDTVRERIVNEIARAPAFQTSVSSSSEAVFVGGGGGEVGEVGGGGSGDMEVIIENILRQLRKRSEWRTFVTMGTPKSEKKGLAMIKDMIETCKPF